MGPSFGLCPRCSAHTNVVYDDACSLPMAKPIRIFQFLVIAALFALTIYTISKNSPYKPVEAIFLIILSGSFLFITLIDIISQFGGDPIFGTSMFLFGVVSTLLFLVAAADIFFILKKADQAEVWRLTVSMALSTTSSLLFFLDLLLIFFYEY